MNKELAPRVVKEVKGRFPTLKLTAEDISQITIITLSTMAYFLRSRTAFSNARLLKHARDSVKSLLESEGE